MKRGLKTAISWLSMISLLFSPITAFGAGPGSNPGELVWPNPGAIQLDKTATPTGTPGEWKITLRAEGKNLRTSSDVVLVIDSSGSMADGSTKLAKAKEAANQFVDHLLLDDSANRIALVAFNKTANKVSDFIGPSQKSTLKDNINSITSKDGTNIQAGLKEARLLLNNSKAQNKYIVLLSDGEPTYSLKGTDAKKSSWSDNSYNFAITASSNELVGNGEYYNLSSKYYVNERKYGSKYPVYDNGIATFSEAKLAKDAGQKIFTVGLEVYKNSTAEKVLKNIKSEGYYAADSNKLKNVYREMAGKISYAAQNAVVYDPMGDMFNLKMKGSTLSSEDYTVSQGEVNWDPLSEKFTWDVGNVAENVPAEFTYTVVIDPSRNPVSNELYPTNGITTMKYKDVNNRQRSKNFEVPKVSIGHGSILMKGYKVNEAGIPVNAEGIEVEKPEVAEPLYSTYYKDENGNEALPIVRTAYSVPAPELSGYQFRTGDNPTNVQLTFTDPTPTIWFGYAPVIEQTATVTVKYLEKDTIAEVAPSNTLEGKIGETIELTAADVPGYTPEEAQASYTVKPEGNEFIFYYTQDKPDTSRSLTVRYADSITGQDLRDPEHYKGVVGQTIKLSAEDITDTVTGAVYKPLKYEDSYTFQDEPLEDVYTFEYTLVEASRERSVVIHHVDRETDMELFQTDEKGVAGEILTVKPEPVSVTDTVYYPENSVYEFNITFDPEQEFYIYYKLGEPSHQDQVQLTVTYLDETTNTVLDVETLWYKVDKLIRLSAKGFKGYTPKIPDVELELTAEPRQYYTFLYTKNETPPAEQQLTVKYLLNGTSQQLASPTVITGQPGETKTLTPVTVTGYTPLHATASYKFTELPGQEYIFYYTRNSSSSGGEPGSSTSTSSTITPLPALPPLPAVPPKLEMEKHYDYINGYPDGTVRPLNNITREEVAAIFYRLLDDESRSGYLTASNSFKDIRAASWSIKPISTMENAGVITGYPDGTFKPEQSITRAEFAAIASRFDKLDERANDKFTDITGHWAEKYIASAANKGWIKGYTDGTFKPDQYITRAEAAAFINSVLNRKVDKQGIHEDAKLWPDNIYGKWYYYDILEATNHHEYTREETEIEAWTDVQPNRIYP